MQKSQMLELSYSAPEKTQKVDTSTHKSIAAEPHTSKKQTMLKLSFHLQISPHQILHHTFHVSSETITIANSTHTY